MCLPTAANVHCIFLVIYVLMLFHLWMIADVFFFFALSLFSVCQSALQRFAAAYPSGWSYLLVREYPSVCFPLE